jgi:micrococcal nuclease
VSESETVTGPAYVYGCSVLRVIDGDTVEASVDLGFGVHIVEKLRLYGIDAPELRGPSRPAGEAARDFLVELLGESDVLWCQTVKDRRGKFGRFLAVLWNGSQSLNRRMIAAGHAVKWGQ